MLEVPCCEPNKFRADNAVFSIEYFSRQNNLNILDLTEESGLYIDGDEIKCISDVVSFLRS
jgi:hypothetical protein